MNANSSDPDEPIEIRKEKMRRERDLESKRKRRKKLQRMLDRIRLGLAGKASIEQNYEIIPDAFGSKYYHVEVEAEIVGIYLESDETFTALVKADWLAGDEDVMDEMYEKLVSEVREIVEKIESITTQRLNVLVFDESEWSGLTRENASWVDRVD